MANTREQAKVDSPVADTAPTRSRSSDVGLRRFARDFRIVLVVAFQLAFSIAASIGVWTLLDSGFTERNLILLAGLAGVVGGSVGPLLRPLPAREATDRAGASLVLSPVVYAAAGFVLAVAIFIAVRSLLVASGPKALNQVGVAAFGGIVGWLAAQIVDGNAAWLSTKSSGGQSRKGETASLVSALGQLDQRMFGQPLHNYDGFVAATWHAPSSHSTLAGKVTVRFLPRVGPGEEHGNGLGPSNRLSSTALARVLVQGGVDVDEAVFSLSVAHGGYDVYPNRVMVHAPLTEPSEEVEFTSMVFDGSPSSDEGRPSIALVEVSQEGQTIQLLELLTPPTESSESEHSS